MLNSSFIATPTARPFDEAENDRNSLNRVLERSVESKAESTSRQLNFHSTKDRPVISIFSKLKGSSSSSATAKALSPKCASNVADALPAKSNSFEEQSASSSEAALVKRTASAPVKSSSLDGTCSELSTPKLTSKSDESSNRSTNDFSCSKVDTATKSVSQLDLKDETPYKTFQMPSTRRLPSSNRLMSSAASKKCRSALESEFRSQKVLFTTPSAVSRPTIQLMSHVGLDDSLNCYKASPIAMHLSPVKEERNPVSKAKVQLKMIADIPPKAAGAATVQREAEPKRESQMLSRHGSEEKTEENQQVIQINGKDFIIHRKLGQGGSSSVFLAEHKESKMECALKVVSLRCDPSLLEGYVREVKILASLQDKENVIRLYE